MDESAPDSGEVLARLEQHYDTGSGLYKLWASPHSVLAAVARGWGAARHPAQLHYAWDLEHARTLDEGIRRTTLEALRWLAIDVLACAPTAAKPALFAEMCRLLRPGRRLVIIDGCPLRRCLRVTAAGVALWYGWLRCACAAKTGIRT
ncbi:hypothetical protein [Polaromonas sp.]|uniref:hypothetical protein n=1 Tax=Polaromonas sp. TaxID=1869339 RepID=UPI003BB56EFA